MSIARPTGARLTASPGRSRFGTARSMLRAAALIAIVVPLAACDPGQGSQGEADGASPAEATVETIEEGVLTVGIFSYMPYVGLEDGKIGGVEGLLISEAAARLDLEVKPVLSDFSGLLGAVQSGRVDVGVGSIGWTSERAEAGLFTDQTYYPRQTVLHRKGLEIDTITDLEGLTVGTGIGYAFVDSLQNMPEVDLRTYPDAASMLKDVELGRIDAVLSDPLINITYAQQHTDILETSPLESPSDTDLEAHPDWINFVTSSAAWYVPENNPELKDALTDVILEFYQDGTLESALTEFGVDDARSWLVPPAQATSMRIPADRPDGWTAPSAEGE